MRLFDTHTHVNFNVFKNDWREVIEQAFKNNVWFVNVGSQSTTSKRAVEIAQNYEKGVYAAVGLHPSHLFEQEIDKLEAGEKIYYKTRAEEFNEDYYLELAKNEKVVAIGECGLDYYGIMNNELGIKNKQRENFIKHIKLAKKVNKPLIIHCRSGEAERASPQNEAGRASHEDLIKILIANYQLLIAPNPGIMHFFTGTLEQALKYIDLGFYISFSGVITFTSAYDSIVKNLPFDKILIETDAPYVAPAPHRGKRNEPSYVIEIAKKIAEIKNISIEEVAEKTTQNAKIVFNIKN